MTKIRERKYYTHKNYGGVYIVVACSANNYQLIDIKTGKRYGNTINERDFDEIVVNIDWRKL